MDFRTIQATGGASYSLVLPKKWIEDNQLKDKDRVFFDYNSNSLIIRPEVNLTQKININIDDLNNSELKREIISLYIIGYDEIHLSGRAITKEIRNKIRKTIQRLAGLEISFEASDSIVLKNIFNPEEFFYLTTIKTMIDMSVNMFRDAIKAYLANNKKLAKDILDRDLEMNKCYFQVLRNFNNLLQGKAPKENRFQSLLEIKYYEYIAVQLERIADHAVSIAAIIAYGGKPAKSDIHFITGDLFEAIIPYLNDIKKVIIAVDKARAHKIIDSLVKKEKAIYELWSNLIHSNLTETMLILGNLDRLKGYIINIAERVIAQHYIVNN